MKLYTKDKMFIFVVTSSESHCDEKTTLQLRQIPVKMKHINENSI